MTVIVTGERLRSWRGGIAVYVALTKPRIILLLLITTVPAMVLAADGAPSVWLILATLFGGTLSAGGANAINCYLDRDIDQLMRRTSGRPLPSHRVEPERALAFGVWLGALGFLFLATSVNLAAALLATGALLFYVFVYTLWLKRRTAQNIVIGGAAGAMPPVVGWAAVTGTVELPAVLLFLLVFVWTPAHFWALALNLGQDYRRASVPMLPVVAGEEETRRQIFAYSLLTVVVSVLLVPLGVAGFVYLSAALLLGAGFVAGAIKLWRHGSRRAALALFKYSLLYLALLFAALVVDQALLG